MAKQNVLLIDDEAEFTATLAERLKIRGMSVETASSGEIALRKVTERDFDAVLLDLAMPGWDGIETLKRLKRARPDLQVVLLTGRATVEKGIKAMKLGAMDLVEKPVKIQELLTKIEEASAKKALLLEARIEHYLDAILRKQGW